MGIMGAKQLFLVLLVSFFLSSCLYSNVFEIDEGKSFEGFKDVYQTDITTLNVVFVHGMGHHPFGEQGVLDYQIRIAKELGFEEADRQSDVNWNDNCGPGFADYPYFTVKESKLLKKRQKEQAVCALRINDVILGFIGWRQYRRPDSDQTLNLFELSWDRATERLQKVLLELDDDYYEKVELDDELEPIAGGRDREKDRAIINQWLKKFVNQKLGDPAIYIGDYGKWIRRLVADGLSRIANAAGMQGNYKYSIVSDSLGSRVAFDALGCAHNGSGCEQTRDLFKSRNDDMRALRKMAAMTSQVFMNANQLPFLALGNVKGPEPGESEIDWLKRFPCESGGPDIKGKLPIKIIAFTDPNDALSYHLTNRFRNKCIQLSGELGRPVEFINVRISNVKWDFGIFASPTKAHSEGFRTNDKAIDLLVNGYPSQ
jgi:hypothetical protein